MWVEVLADAALEREGLGRRRRRRSRSVSNSGHLIVQPLAAGRAARRAVAAVRLRGPRRANSPIARSARVSGVSRRNRLGGNRSTAPRTTPWVSWVSTSPSTGTRKFVERTVGGEHVGDVAERVLVRGQPAVAETSMRQSIDILAVVVARRQPQHLDHAGGRRVVAVDGLWEMRMRMVQDQ